MAIYHFSVKAISRADGRSAIAAAAYRSGEKLIDQKQQKEQDYTRKTGVEFKKIYAPDNAKAELLDRQSLWNIVEKVENRKNSVLAREFEIAFPQELNAEQRQQLLDDLCKKIVERHNVIVDAVIHAPHTRGGSDERNYHAHILFTSRQLDKDTGEFSKNKFRDFNKEKSSETVAAWRKDFADLANHYLEKNNFDARIDHRSYADRGIDLEATLHEGSAVTAMKRKYEREQLKPVEERNPKIIMPIIALENNAIKARNAEKQQILRGLEQEIVLSEKILDGLKQLERTQKAKDQHEAEIRATKQAHTATEAKIRTEPPKPQENRLERKSAQSSPIVQDTSISDKKIAVRLFETKVRALAEKIHHQELENIKQKMGEYMELSKNLLNQIETHKENKPFNPFKIKAWTKELDDLVHKHDNGIKAQYDNLKTDYQRIKNLGVTHEHWKKADAQMYQLDKNAYQKIKAFEIELNERNSVTSIKKSLEKDNDKGR